jgi:hydroxycarboxylate dehydrogenase B
MALIHIIEAERLRVAMRRVLLGFGSSSAEATEVADNLVLANLTGHDSHGVGMIPRYAEAFREGGLVPNTSVATVLDAGSLLRLDGQSGFGQVVGRQAMDMGIERARRHGSCLLALGQAHHLGRIGAFAEQVAQAGLVSLHFVSVISRSLVAPHGGSDARFGTNPFTAGVPLKNREPFILDFATSVVALGKTRVAHNKGERLPAHHLLDDQGVPTNDPRFSLEPPFGAILTFGAHKGYGLAVLCELLGGALAAGQTLHEADPGRKRILNGMFSVLLDPRALGAADDGEAEALRFIDWVSASPPQAGVDRVRVAGEPEREMRARRERDGVPVDATTWLQILEAADALGVPPADVQRLAGLAGSGA